MSLTSEFALNLRSQMTSTEINSALFGKKQFGALNFYIYRSDQVSIYVKTIENDCEYFYRYDLNGKKLKRNKIIENPDVWSASFDGKDILRHMSIDKKNKSDDVQIPKKDSSFGRKMISLSVRQATFERIDDGRKNLLAER